MSKYLVKQSAAESERLDKQYEILSISNDLNRWMKPGDHLLDIGCGTGKLSSLIKDEVNYTGIDINNVFAGKGNFINGNYLEHIFAEPFDVIYARLVLWSQKDVDAFLSKIRSDLKTGGVFFSYEPDDSRLLFESSMPHMRALCQAWQDIVRNNQQNTSIGSTLAKDLSKMQFSNIEVKDYKFIRRAGEGGFSQAIKNLFSLFSSLTQPPEGFSKLVDKAQTEINATSENPDFAFTECYVQTVGTKT